MSAKLMDNWDQETERRARVIHETNYLIPGSNGLSHQLRTRFGAEDMGEFLDDLCKLIARQHYQIEKLQERIKRLEDAPR